MKRDIVWEAVVDAGFVLPDDCTEVLLDDVDNPTRIIFRCGGGVSYTPELARPDADQIRKHVQLYRVRERLGKAVKS